VTGRATGLGGVFFRAKDPDALGAWYRDTLGVPVEEGRFAVYRWRDHDDASREGSTVWAAFDDDTDYFGPGGKQLMLNFRVADLDRVLDELRTEGVEVIDRVEETPQGRFGWIVDPEGNRIELWQPAPGM
jgi:predicted enzyme related to lactoylglutathione lyase